MSAPEELEKIERLIEQASTEIVLSEPGTDRSQFPLCNLLSSIASKATENGLESLEQAASRALEIVEGLLFSSTPYDASHLDILNELAAAFTRYLRDPELTFEEPSSLASASTPTATTTAPAKPSAIDEDALQKEAAPSAAAAQDFDEVATLPHDADTELLTDFVVEALEHIDAIEQGVLTLEENPDDTETISAIFRGFHTIKGGSGFLSIIPVNRLAHNLENLLDLIRSGRTAASKEMIEVILEGADIFRNYLTELRRLVVHGTPAVPIHVPCVSLLTTVTRLLAEIEGTAPPEVAPAITTAANDTLPFPAEATPLAPARTSAPASAPGSTSTTAANNAAAAGKASARAAAGMIKVDTSKFDSLMDLVGELVIAQSLVAQDPAMRDLESRNLLRNLSQLARITNELQKTAMSLRMVPIKNTFQKMNRLVRDTAAACGKQIELVLQGEDTEMDRTIVEELADPLLHMVRNSVDHGIESPEVRAAAGKPRQGRLILGASHAGGNILIEITDDGAGIRTDKVLAKAIERGIVEPGTQLPPQEIFGLIFEPGFSTADQVTDLSGRGVGMDVVKRNISRLRGKIEIESTVGSGTSFKIYLPLTLAIIDGLLVSIGNQRYILPTLSVRESFRPTKGMISTVHGKGEMVNVRGKLCPLLRLYDLFGVTPRSKDATDSMVVVVESAHEERCILVDDLLGQQEVVIKSLGETFKNNRLLAGAAILGDGCVGLILDPRALVQINEGRARAA